MHARKGTEPARAMSQDTSTGEMAACLTTRMGTCDVMRQNPFNACLALGHPNGVVTMWAPNMGVPLVRMLCHKVSGSSPAQPISSDEVVVEVL